MDNLERVRNGLVPSIVKSQIEKMVFNYTAPRIKKQVLLKNKFGGCPVFCIVHWNAPDFLLLNVSQIEFLYPNSKIYILDNGSQQICIYDIVKGLKRFKNITLFAASPGYPNWETRIGADHWLYSHAKGLQFLLNYAAEQQDEVAVFLDQDCLSSGNIGDLIAKLGRNVMLIGARARTGDKVVHASFMILQPKRIKQLFGKFSLFHERTNSFEPYHGLSFKTQGKILFLESTPNEKIPLFTSYSFQGTTYAWHAWYSSRTTLLPAKMLLSGNLSIPYLQSVRKLAYDYLKQIHEETTRRR